MARSSTVLALEEFVPYRLSVLTNRASRAIAALYERRFDLKLPEWRVMAVLGRSPGLTASEVVDRTAMDKVAISRAVARLTQMGRLEAKADRADARRQMLFLSSKGTQIYREIVPLAKKVEAKLLADLSAADLAQLDRLLTVLTEAAGTLPEA